MHPAPKHIPTPAHLRAAGVRACCHQQRARSPHAPANPHACAFQPPPPSARAPCSAMHLPAAVLLLSTRHCAFTRQLPCTPQRPFTKVRDQRGAAHVPASFYAPTAHALCMHQNASHPTPCLTAHARSWTTLTRHCASAPMHGRRTRVEGQAQEQQAAAGKLRRRLREGQQV
jgi:hypothetical protein